MYNLLQEKKDETCSEEQVMPIQSEAPRVRDTMTEERASESG